MNFNLIDTLFNIIVMLFWIRLWNSSTEAAFNIYLSLIKNITESVLELFRLVLTHPALAATTIVCLLLLFRAVALSLTNQETIQEAWKLRFGFESISPASCQKVAEGGQLIFHEQPLDSQTQILHKQKQPLLFIGFSVLSFAIFLFHIWTLSMLFLVKYRHGRRGSNAAEFLHTLALPFSNLSPAKRPWFLVFYGMLISASINLALRHSASQGVKSLIVGILPVFQYAVNACAGIIDILLILQYILMVLIIGSWLVIFIGNQTLIVICREWLDFFLTPFRRFHVHIGMFDLTPIIAFLALGFMHWVLKGGFFILYVYLHQI